MMSQSYNKFGLCDDGHIIITQSQRVLRCFFLYMQVCRIYKGIFCFFSLYFIKMSNCRFKLQDKNTLCDLHRLLHKIGTEKMIKLYYDIVKSIAEYGCITWQFTQKSKPPGIGQNTEEGNYLMLEYAPNGIQRSNGN